MPTIKPKRPKPDNLPRIRFDRNTALVTGLGAAMILGPEALGGYEHHTRISPLLSAAKTTAFGHSSTTNSRLSGEATGLPTIETLSEEERWTEADKKRFQELAIAEAVGSLSQEESVELEQLTNLRRVFDNPRTGDEALWEFEQRRRTRELLETLRRYVEFYEGADPAWAAAGKGSHRQ